jgi:hypothetical protein
MLKAIETVYKEYRFRSRIEARWAVFFDTLEVEWEYEPLHYDLGLKHHWDDYTFQEQLNEAIENSYYDEDRSETIREVYRKRYEKLMYLPDFYLFELDHWVEIKGKPPTSEERNKARKLAKETNIPITILWGNIPDPKVENWAECTEVYGGDMNIIALLVLECGVKSMQSAFTAARQARFEQSKVK